MSEYPERDPDTGRVLNPLTGNWIKPSYAKREDILEKCEEHTQTHFREQDTDSSEEIDDLLDEIDQADAEGGFELDEDEFLPDESDFPDTDEFDPEQGAEPDDGFVQPPTPEGFDDAAQQRKSTDSDHKGIYTGKSKSGPRRQKSNNKPNSPDDEEKRYVRTDSGGMKVVYPNRNNSEE